MKVLSLFDGISCGMIAIQRAGFNIERYIAYEIDDIAIGISKKNYPQIEHRGNVFEGDFTEYEGFDLLIGGSPCTHWSIARQDRETDTDGEGFRLFQEYVRALKESKCKYFMFENNFKIDKKIQNAITKALGVEPIIIDSATVSAQSRTRMYWTNIPNVTQPEEKGLCVKDVLAEHPKKFKNYFGIAKFKDNYKENATGRTIRLGEIGKGGQAERIYSINGKSTTLKANGGGQGAKTGLYLIDDVVRKLYPLEAERLQTLPDNYTEGIKDIHRYRCIGNGWTVDVVSHILSFIKER